MINVICRIVIPSIIFASIEYIPACLIRNKPMDIVSFLYKTIGGGTYWFTSALVVAELIILVLLMSRKKNIWFYFVIILLVSYVGICFQNGLYDIEIWAWHRGTIATLLLACGGLYWKYEEILSRWMKWYVFLLLLVLYFAILLFCKNIDPNISILTIQPWGIVSTILSCILLIELCKHLSENTIINYIGQNTLGFYFLSGAVPIVMSMLFHKLTEGTHLWIMWLDWLSSLLVSFVIVKVINRWLPWLLDIRLIKHKQ